jgi:hypothetical protein
MLAKRIAPVLLLACAAAAGAAVSVGGWEPAGKPETYTRKNLYDYIDGGADYYLAYDFRKLTVQRYRRGRDEITVELYDMGSAPEAFGAWANDPPREQPRVGQQAAYAAGLLQFWKGPIYGRVFADHETPDLKRAVIGLGKEAAFAIKQTGRLPDLLKALPARGRVARSERYLHQETSLNNVLYLGSGNPLGLSAKTEAVFARYGAKGETKLLIVRYPARAAAEQALGRRGEMEKSPGLRASNSKPAILAARDARGRAYLILETGAPGAGEGARLAGQAKAAVERLR